MNNIIPSDFIRDMDVPRISAETIHSVTANQIKAGTITSYQLSASALGKIDETVAHDRTVRQLRTVTTREYLTILAHVLGRDLLTLLYPLIQLYHFLFAGRAKECDTPVPEHSPESTKHQE